MKQRSRRAFLAVLGSSVVGAAGCLSDGERLSVLAAGSLAVALETLGEEFAAGRQTTVEGEYHGSTVVMQMIEDGTRHPDVTVSADVQMLRDRLYPEFASWDVVFAANELGLAYNPETQLGSRLEGDEPWYEVLRSADEGAIAMSEPEHGSDVTSMDTTAERDGDEYIINGRKAWVSGAPEPPAPPPGSHSHRPSAGHTLHRRAGIGLHRHPPTQYGHSLPTPECPRLPAGADRHPRAASDLRD